MGGAFFTHYIREAKMTFQYLTVRNITNNT